MTLEELSEEYVRSADNILSMIRSGEARLRDVQRSGDGDAVLRLRRYIADMRFQRDHLLDVAHHLKTYYEPPDG
jgi:hypothetical protein